MIIIGNVLDQHEVAALREAAESLAFEDGARTAGRYAHGVKHNTQAVATAERDAILAKVRKALNQHEVFQSAARPRHYARMLISRYRSGMEYGSHVDDAIINGCRTDLSFTVFLSEPDAYEGGGLVVEDAVEARVIRLQPGDAVLYPTSALHRVEPVSRGERLAIVGWLTSWVRDPARREILFDLDAATRTVFEAEGKTPAVNRLLKAKSNLYRMWADG